MKNGDKKSIVNDRPISEEVIFKVAKEIVVKYIEIGRVPPGNFSVVFDQIYKGLKKSVHK
jgi:hypothetical protein